MLQLDLHLVDIDAGVSMLHRGYRVVHDLDSIRSPGYTTGVNWPLKKVRVKFLSSAFCVDKFLCVLINQITELRHEGGMFSIIGCCHFSIVSIVIQTFQSFHPFPASKVTCDSSLDLQEAVKKISRQVGQKGFLESDLFNLRFDAEKPGQLFRPPRDLSPEKLRLLINSFEKERQRSSLGSPTHLVIYYNRGPFRLNQKGNCCVRFIINF